MDTDQQQEIKLDGVFKALIELTVQMRNINDAVCETNKMLRGNGNPGLVRELEWLKSAAGWEGGKAPNISLHQRISKCMFFLFFVVRRTLNK